jgi:hypothetical protein
VAAQLVDVRVGRLEVEIGALADVARGRGAPDERLTTRMQIARSACSRSSPVPKQVRI